MGQSSRLSNITTTVNPHLKSSDRYSLRNNPVVPLIDRIENRIASQGPYTVERGTMRVTISEVKREMLGDLYLPNGSVVPELIGDTGKYAWGLYNPNYSNSYGYVKAREAVQLYYREVYEMDIPINRIILGEGVTGLMQPLGKLFMASEGQETPKAGMGAIGYAPWPGTMIQYGIYPHFVQVDGKHQSLVNAEDIGTNVKFVLLYTVGNPGGMCLEEKHAESVINAIKEAMERQGKAIFLVIDDAYEALMPKEKIINIHKLCEKYKVPYILMSGFDKAVSTGAHGGWMLIWMPPEMEKLTGDIDNAMASIHGQYLGTNSVTQLQIMMYNLARLGMTSSQIDEWILKMLPNAPTRSEHFDSRYAEYKKMGWLDKAETLERDIAANLKNSWGWTNSVLEVFAGKERIVRLQGEKPDIPYYLFLRYGGDASAQKLAVDIAENTGIGVTPGDPFIAEEFAAKYGTCFRLAIVNDPVMAALDGSGRKVNFAEPLVDYLRFRIGETETKRDRSLASLDSVC